jgi:hypothetical protein
MSIFPRAAATLACALALASAATAVEAAVIERQEVRMSTDVCQPALPAFDGNIRKRPLAMQNEGDSPAFVTCAFGGVFNGVPSQKTISVGFTNNTSAEITVHCTLADAQAGVIDPEYFPKSIAVPPDNAPVTLLLWSAVNDNGGVRFTYPSVSCVLPPGTGVVNTLHTFDEEIGS